MEHKNKSVWAEMSPVRKKFLKIFLPIWLSVTLIPLIPICILIGINEEKYLPLIIIWAVTVLVIGLLTLLFLPWLNKKEALFILSNKYAYLLQDAWAGAEEYETVDYETGIAYTVQKEGLKIVFPLPQDYVQVFDETPDNIEFLPWDRTRFALATTNAYKQVKMALAVIDVSTAQIEEDGETSYLEPLFVPFDERLVRAIKGYGLEEKTDGGWAYLFYNPQDAMEQIYKKGYVRVLRDKKTGKRLTEEEWENREK